MNPRLFQNIARKLTKELNIKMGGVTAEQVACVANGTERTMSHPVIAAIRTELHKAKIILPSEHELHARTQVIARQRAEETPCFGGA